MTVIAFPAHAHWVRDVRGEGRAVRVSTHAEAGLVNLSIWRAGTCVGTVRLLPVDAATLVSGLADGLAELVRRGEGDADRLHDVEERLARLESELRAPVRRRLPAPVVVALRRLRELRGRLVS